jgi:hypothetical protein
MVLACLLRSHPVGSPAGVFEAIAPTIFADLDLMECCDCDRLIYALECCYGLAHWDEAAFFEFVGAPGVARSLLRVAKIPHEGVRMAVLRLARLSLPGASVADLAAALTSLLVGRGSTALATLDFLSELTENSEFAEVALDEGIIHEICQLMAMGHCALREAAGKVFCKIFSRLSPACAISLIRESRAIDSLSRLIESDVPGLVETIMATLKAIVDLGERCGASFIADTVRERLDSDATFEQWTAI